jgi:lipopolysaccharide biosynthesis regulator YciM
VVSLWETQAHARARAGDAAGAAALWARAGDLAEQRLQDASRAIRSYASGAELGGETSLEALARLYAASGEHEKAAEALTKLCAQSSPEVLAERALELADQYQAFGANEQVRACLEQAAQTALDAAGLRARLAELYRAERDFTALAGLLAEEAERSVDRKATLAILREAFELHLVERRDPFAAIPLIERAVELDPEDHRQRLRLAQALHQAKRYDDAVSALRAQIERYGSRRPKDRALAHFELAKVLLAAEREREALVELDAASKIDPAHPGIMQILARAALEHDELDRAEKMYRSLLLVLGREDGGDGPSKAEALIALSEIATRRGDAARAGEFIESAFESALESPRDALALEVALRTQGRHELLARALETRLARNPPPAEAAAALADLVVVHAQGLNDLDSERPGLERRAHALEESLAAQSDTDDAAWAALSRVYDELGDSSREAAILERRLSVMPHRSSRPPADPDLFYRLAKVRLSDAETFEQGLDLLERALSLAPDYARARSLLASQQGGSEERVSELFERIARATGDDRALADALATRLSRPDANTAGVREGVELAVRLGDGELGARMLKLGLALETGSDADKAWIRLELGKLAEASGDSDAALAYREQAADFLSPEEARALRLSLAQAFAAVPAQRARAVLLFERVLSDNPFDRSVWQPLLDLLRDLGDLKRLERLLAVIAPQVEDLSERSTLRIERVNALLGTGARDSDVISLLQEIVADDPAQRDAARVLAELLEREGRLDDLAELLQGEIDRAKDERTVSVISELSLRLAGLRERQERIADALDVCRAALEWEPTDRPLLEVVLRLSETARDPAAQCEALEGLLRVEQGEAAARLARRLSTLREELGDTEGAERALVLGFEANPSDASLRDLLIVRFAERDEHGRVAEVLAHALREQPNDRKLLERLVEAHRAEGNSEAALSVIDTLIEQEPVGVTLYRDRAALLAELGRDIEAVETLERALERDASLAGELIEALERAIARAEGESEVALTLRLVEIFEQSGDLPGARARLAAFVREAPPSLEALRRLATLEAKTGNLAGAITTLQEIAQSEQGPGLIDTALRLYETCALAGRSEDARAALERAFHADRKHPGVREKLYALYEASGENGRLSELLLEQAMATVDLADRLALLLRAGGLLLGEGGDPEAAVRILETARQDNPENLQAIVLLARAYSRAQRAEDGLALLNSIADANRGRRGKGLGPVYTAMAEIHLDEGFLTDALQALTKAFELDPKNGELAMRLGQLAIEIDEDETAQRAFRAVAIMKPPAPGSSEGALPDAKADANYFLAVLARKQGDARKAKVLASKALGEKPGHEAARQLLAELASA